MPTQYILGAFSLCVLGVSFVAVAVLFVIILSNEQRRDSWTHMMILVVAFGDVLIVVEGLLRAIMTLGNFQLSKVFLRVAIVLEWTTPYVITFASCALALNRMAVVTMGVEEDHWMFDLFLELSFLALIPIAAINTDITEDSDFLYQNYVYTQKFNKYFGHHLGDTYSLMKWLQKGTCLVGLIFIVCCYGWAALFMAKDRKSWKAAFTTMCWKIFYEGLIPFSVLYFRVATESLNTNVWFAFFSMILLHSLPAIRVVVFYFTFQ
ncbi:hypothetical protein QR680_012313 [Steinernema hermaphroditum]|uniref:Uncharacterized protein n=1 Tax=Steinernema hermaphroditum TaxID=289476 RepID=A0AA39I3L3_9BILA|nr:hypothetical protein QR680_012313 [Steinernema hermaphroditum]